MTSRRTTGQKVFRRATFDWFVYSVSILDSICGSLVENQPSPAGLRIALSFTVILYRCHQSNCYFHKISPHNTFSAFPFFCDILPRLSAPQRFGLNTSQSEHTWRSRRSPRPHFTATTNVCTIISVCGAVIPRQSYNASLINHNMKGSPQITHSFRWTGRWFMIC